MGKFSLEIEFDGDGPSSPRPKKRRFILDELEEESSQHNRQQLEEEDDDDDEEELISEAVEHDDEEKDQEDSVQPSTSRSKADGSISVTLTDPDVLDCLICFEPLTIPVFQCENGHIACSFCCNRLRNKCPSCSFPIGYNRCRAIEKVLESLKISCRNAKYGCKDLLVYGKINDHEKTCIHLPITCPFPDCQFIAGPVDVYHHLKLQHVNSVTSFSFNTYFPISLEMDKKYQILQLKDEEAIFVLNHSVDRLGSLVNLTNIGLRWKDRRFSYDLVAKNGSCTVRLQSSAECDPNWSPRTPLRSFILVPSEILGPRKQLELEVCVWETDKYKTLE